MVAGPIRMDKYLGSCKIVHDDCCELVDIFWFFCSSFLRQGCSTEFWNKLPITQEGKMQCHSHQHNLFLLHQINKHIADKQSTELEQLPTIRTIGLLKHYDPITHTALIEDENDADEIHDDDSTTKNKNNIMTTVQSIMIDLSLIPQFHAQRGSWYTVLGSLEKKYDHSVAPQLQSEQRSELQSEQHSEQHDNDKKQPKVIYFVRAKIAQEMKLRGGSSSITLWKRALVARQKYLSIN